MQRVADEKRSNLIHHFHTLVEGLEAVSYLCKYVIMYSVCNLEHV